MLVRLLRLCAGLSAMIVLVIVAFLVRESLPALRSVGIARFVTDASWHPATDAADGTFHLVPMIAGTLLTTAGAVLVAGPLGIASALFCRYYAPPVLAGQYRIMIELLAGIPSVVYGFWGLVVLVPMIAEIAQPGSSLLAGILILALMILPTVALMADAAIGSVPQEFLQAAAALGMTRWGTISGVVLPTARSGLLTAVILATMRALGETMAVLMVCGNVVQLPGSLFDPVRTLTANIALEMAYAMGDHRSALFVSGLLLMGLVTLLVAAAEFASRPRPFARHT